MDKPEDSSTSNSDQLRINKLSHKISKPTRRPVVDAPPPSLPPPLPQNQPPVYNINRNDFRQVVQQLTGSPACYEQQRSGVSVQQVTGSAACYEQQQQRGGQVVVQQQLMGYNDQQQQQRSGVQKVTGSGDYNEQQRGGGGVGQNEMMSNMQRRGNVQGDNNSNMNMNSGSVSSRLQRIRPPPLAQIGARPNSPLVPTQGQLAPPANNSWLRPFPPMSPLPPFPAVHAAAESPISAYMRFLQSSSSSCQSPLAFGCLSPLFSPSGLSGLPPFPLSPTPLPSPGKRTN